METYRAAAADQRIRAAVPCIGVQSFRCDGRGSTTPSAAAGDDETACSRAYTEAGAPDPFEFLLQANTPHRANTESRESATGLFVRWLGRPEPELSK